ncbi:hypothetical protein HYT02_03905 [Candidatus Gottesmanbacteria bacterium]|nr:hypothetical protein [Candidatus Gottesmanbacteria bacterium]
MAVTKETIQQVRKMPHILGRIRNEVLFLEPEKTEPAVEGILNEENYTLSKRQKNVLETGLPLFIHDREGLEDVLSDGRKYQEIRTRVGIKHKLRKYSRVGKDFHPTSITFVLDPENFKTAWNESNDYASESDAIGFTNRTYSIPYNGYEIRYSFRDGSASNSSASDHENQHVLNRYVHPHLLNTDFFDTDLSKASESFWNVKDRRSFNRTLKYLSFHQLYNYLDELTATSLKRNSVLSQFIGDKKCYYGKIHSDRILALRRGLPNRGLERLFWEKMIHDENKILQHKIKFIDREYDWLRYDRRLTDEVTNILQSLTPNRAYLIKLFTTKTISELDIYRWAREYFNDWQPKDSIEKRLDLTNFLNNSFLNTTEGTEVEDVESFSKVFAGRVLTHKNDILSSQSVGNESFDFSFKPFDVSQIEDVVSVVKDASVNMFNLIRDDYIPFIDQQNLSGEENQDVKFNFFRENLKPDFVFYLFVEGYETVMNQVTDDLVRSMNNPEDKARFKDIVGYEQEMLARRALEIDDATEDMLSVFKKSEVIDFDQLFAPGYRKKDETYQNMLQAIINKPTDIGKLAPHITREQAVKFASFILRLLIWSQEKSLVSDNDQNELKKYIKLMRQKRILPTIFESLSDSLSIN